MLKVIRCPHCRCEYLPGEIFTPEHFLGQPKNVIRNNIGEVLGCTGIEMDTTEMFTCIKCDKEFTVIASVNFNTSDGTEVTVEQPPLF